ncbi:SLATT domain-containing protein [Nocardia sp. NPDC057455]|uniref:SLATT domain-containing protein n=1 Tax=Nocardia sp. NPDC057455 TaxID=3346138 RepID=UPI00366F7EA1
MSGWPSSFDRKLTSPMSDDLLADRRQAIDEELQRLEESAMYSAQNQFEQAKQWRGVNLFLGLPASVLAAVSGAAALASTANAFWAGVLALASAAFGAVLTTVNASHRTNQAAAAANAYLEIQTAARQARLLDLPNTEIDEMRSVVAEITARRDEQNKTAEPPNRWARKRAQKNIAGGGQTYDVDSTGTGV